MRIFKYNIKYIKFKLNWSIFFVSKYSQKSIHFCHNMATELMKVGLTDHLVSPKNISHNKIAPYAACLENQNSN